MTTQTTDLPQEYFDEKYQRLVAELEQSESFLDQLDDIETDDPEVQAHIDSIKANYTARNEEMMQELQEVRRLVKSKNVPDAVALLQQIDVRFGGLDQLRGEFDSLSTLVNGLQIRISDVEGKVDDHDGRIIKVESDIMSLNTRMDTAAGTANPEPSLKLIVLIGALFAFAIALLVCALTGMDIGDSAQVAGVVAFVVLFVLLFVFHGPDNPVSRRYGEEFSRSKSTTPKAKQAKGSDNPSGSSDPRRPQQSNDQSEPDGS